MKIMITVVMITVMVVEPDDGSVAFTHGFYDTGGFVKKKTKNSKAYAYEKKTAVSQL